MDLFVIAGSLVCELVAGEIQDLKSLVVKFILHCLKGLILRSEAASCCGIYDHKDLTLKPAQRNLAAVLGFNCEIVCVHNCSFLSGRNHPTV